MLFRSFQERQGVFADSVKPVGMRDPFYFEISGKVRKLSQLSFLQVQFIKYDPVIDPANPGLFSALGMEVIQFFPFLYQFGEANNGDAGIILCAIKINPGFLVVGLDLE